MTPNPKHLITIGFINIWEIFDIDKIEYKVRREICSLRDFKEMTFGEVESCCVTDKGGASTKY